MRAADEKNNWSHVDAQGEARMVNVGPKSVTARRARAAARVRMGIETYRDIVGGRNPKGAVLAVARVAGIQGAKRTGDWIPLCHTLPLEQVEIDFQWRVDGEVAVLVIETTVGATAKTGVEMEALTAAAASALTVYDMCKARDRGMVVECVELLEKRGGKSGTWQKPSPG